MAFTLYLISQPYLSARKLSRLRGALAGFTTGPSDLIRLEREGQSLWANLDSLAARGETDITLRPIGLPNSESLLRWLDGAVGEWLSGQDPSGPAVWMTEDLSDQDAVLSIIGGTHLARRRIAPCPRGADGKGWDRPPAHRHHILVCTGPRCHLRDAPDLLGVMKSEIGHAGISGECLVTSSGCLFPCNAGPVVVHYPSGLWYRLPDRQAITAFVRTVLVEDRPLPQYETYRSRQNQYAH